MIIGAGLFVALLQFDSFDKLAGAALASSAVIAAVAGLAARQSLGNVIAGVTLALTQPIRVGDLVEIGDQRGRVEDLTLTFTWLRTADGRRIALPNELLMTQPLRNETLGRERDRARRPASGSPPAPTPSARSACCASSTASRRRRVDDIAPAGVRLRVAARARARRRARVAPRTSCASARWRRCAAPASGARAGSAAPERPACRRDARLRLGRALAQARGPAGPAPRA